MPLSRYLKIFPCPDRPGSHILYSTKKGSTVRVSAALLAAARSDTLGDSDRAALARLEMVVDDPAAERAAMASLVEKTNARSSRFKATVVLNLACNLACSYCYEEDFRRGDAMGEATAQLLVDHVLHEQIERGREVELRFYGGEPLLSVPMLKAIAGPLRDAAQACGTRFSCSMVTNGTLLTRPVVEELLPFGLKSAQITLDGPPEIHDLQRPFVSGEGSFAPIVANTKAVCDLVTLNPGGNFTRENYRAFPAMLDLLLAAGIDPQTLGPVMFAPILPKSGRPSVHDAGSACVTSGEPWLAEAALFLREETLRRGFAAMKPTMGACMVEFDNDLVVNWDGSLYKCPAFMGWPELSVGTLASGVTDYRQSHNLDCWRNDACLDCAYLPLCFGGCRLITLMHSGAVNGVDCRKPFYDNALEQIVMQDLRYQQSG
ncbi:geopeptide radical SAM maturase [Geobacter argillaceus]|uniref:Radical SAM core domain-containing protein n=1 Tax=Geobacter argillaceus TaxID=345631 RepID=A0A562VPL0_9BACT|nr:geopeptide radical SAM maturase [Geobacter argillaceus]TWJ19869.1 uncharacterized protein JN12_01359 [Geobacter argillaceus]